MRWPRGSTARLWGFATLICVPAIFILLALPAREDGDRRRMGVIEIAGLVAATAVTGLFVVSTIAAQFDWTMSADQSVRTDCRGGQAAVPALR